MLSDLWMGGKRSPFRFCNTDGKLILAFQYFVSYGIQTKSKWLLGIWRYFPLPPLSFSCDKYHQFPLDMIWELTNCCNFLPSKFLLQNEVKTNTKDASLHKLLPISKLAPTKQDKKKLSVSKVGWPKVSMQLCRTLNI